MSPLISVIVPIYKSEPYLAKCLRSLISQTMADFEIICVDDASPDNSRAIAESIAAVDRRIRIIAHKTNMGLGAARNTGIYTARGAYIASVDSDDYVSCDFLYNLYRHVLDTNMSVDLVCTGYERVHADGSTISEARFPPRMIKNENNEIDIFRVTAPSFCTKLWRKQIFLDNELWFPHGLYFEDLATTPRYLTFCRQVVMTDGVEYKYLARSDSITHSMSDKHILDYFRVFSLLQQFLLNRGLYKRYSAEFGREIELAMRFYSRNVALGREEDAKAIDCLRFLLLNKWAFLNYHDQVMQMSVPELMSNLDSSDSLK